MPTLLAITSSVLGAQCVKNRSYGFALGRLYNKAFFITKGAVVGGLTSLAIVALCESQGILGKGAFNDIQLLRP